MFFLKLLAALTLVLALSEQGSGNDPNGGGAMDPNGGASAASVRCGDEGSGLDPHGGPCPGAR